MDFGELSGRMQADSSFPGCACAHDVAGKTLEEEE